MPSLFGFPDDATVLQCSNYGSTGGQYSGPDGLRTQWSNTIVPPTQVSSDAWLSHINTVMTGNNSVILKPLSAEEQAAQNLGISLLPWNRRSYDRYLWGASTPYPLNPWNEQTIFDNGMTVLKVAGVGLGSYYGATVAYKLFKDAR